MTELNSVINLEGKSPDELEMVRQGLVQKAAGKVDNLDDDDLRLLAAVAAQLRRRSSGPPKAKKAASRIKLSVDDL